MEYSESELLTLLATDLRRYFAELVVRYQARLYVFARRLTNSAHDAEDIVQEAFVGAYVSLENYPSERIRALKLQAWLYKITLNVYYHSTRSTRLHLVSLDLSEEGQALAIEEDESERPEALFARKELQQELEALLAQLPQRYRVALTCYFFEQLTYQQVADLLEQPVGTVKSTVSRGLRLLRTMLKTSNEKGKGTRHGRL
jgi:RNA polymerase sigma-70 factor (ECF subfamily)